MCEKKWSIYYSEVSYVGSNEYCSRAKFVAVILVAEVEDFMEIFLSESLYFFSVFMCGENYIKPVFCFNDANIF